MFSYNTKLVDRGWVWKKTVRKKGKTKGRIDTHYEKAFGSRKAYLRSITKIEEYLHCVDRHNNEEYLLLCINCLRRRQSDVFIVRYTTSEEYEANANRSDATHATPPSNYGDWEDFDYLLNE